MKTLWNKTIAITITAALLSACHHENPLTTHTRKLSASFLVSASANVEKRLHFAIQQDAYGYGYGYLECMEGKQSPEIQCADLYQGMVAFAKENHYVGFQSITLSDLTDLRIFKILGDDYAETAATTWPHYFPVGNS